MKTVEKASPHLTDKWVRQVSRLIADRDDPEHLAVAEIALLELALADLGRNSEAIRVGFEAYTRNINKKFVRAYAKTVLSKAETPRGTNVKGMDIPDRQKQWVRPHTRDGQSIAGYFRRRRKGEEQSEETQLMIDRFKEFERQRESIDEESLGVLQRLSEGRGRRAREAQSVLDTLRQGPAGIATTMAALTMESLAEDLVKGQEGMKGAAQAFLRENPLTQRIASVADYFVNKGSKFRFFAQAVRDYGPIVAVQMANVYFRYGGYDVPLQGSKTEFGDNLPPVGASREEVRNWAVNTLRGRLPGEESKDARAKPPSEGFIIDRKGNIVAHGVGRGIDHYLPFSARHLRRLRKTEGGEFIRRRMFGGPTVEDLHAAMMMGADRLTVVSNGGVFTVELTGRSHGLRLEHMQVLGRFQAIMDRETSDNDSVRDHGVYARAMSLLGDEFPLHFRTNASREGGKWAEGIHDYVQPRNRFRDQIMNLFDVVTEDKTKASVSTEREDSKNRDFVPGKDSWRTRFSDRTKAGTDPEIALASIRNAYIRRDVPVPPSLMRELERVRDMKRGSPSSSAKQKARQVLPSGVSEKQAEVHRQTQQKNQTPPVNWAARYSTAADRLDSLGYRISDKAARDNRAMSFVRALENLDDSQFEAAESIIREALHDPNAGWADAQAALEGGFDTSEEWWH